jgi:hypothetical protein
MSAVPSGITAVTVKQLRDAALSVSSLGANGEAGGDADTAPFELDGIQVNMVRLIVSLTDARILKTSEWTKCIAGDSSGSLAVYFYPRKRQRPAEIGGARGGGVGVGGAAPRRVVEENEDVNQAPQVLLVDDDLTDRIPMEPDEYYVLHGRPHLDTCPAGRPATRACISVVHARRVTKQFDLITHHFLECIHHHLERVRGTARIAHAHAPASGVRAPAATPPAPPAARKRERERERERERDRAESGSGDAFFSSGSGADSDAASDML